MNRKLLCTGIIISYLTCFGSFAATGPKKGYDCTKTVSVNPQCKNNWGAGSVDYVLSPGHSGTVKNCARANIESQCVESPVTVGSKQAYHGKDCTGEKFGLPTPWTMNAC